MRKGKLLIISGPSGVGKGTIVKQVINATKKTVNIIFLINKRKNVTNLNLHRFRLSRFSFILATSEKRSVPFNN